MKMPLILLLLLLSCRGHQEKPLPIILKDSVQKISSAERTVSDSFDYQTTAFTLVKKFPRITDTTAFIRELRANCHITGDEFPVYDSTHPASINFFRKIKINGSIKDYYIVEYDWHGDGPNIEFPWKKQFLFDTTGKLIKVFQALRIESKKIFPNQESFLMELTSSARGNGGHRIYKVTSDTLENIYEGYYNYDVQTYCAYQSGLWLFEPYELNLSVKDINEDGYNDLTFSGKLVLIEGLTKDSIWYNYIVDKNNDTIEYSPEHPFKKLPLRYTFLYNPKTGHFVESDTYSKPNPF